MKKNYFFFIITIIALFTVQVHIAQDRGNQNPIEQNIEGLSIYPNPVNHTQNSIYITSKLNSVRYIEFYDVLGKRIFTSNIRSKELNISSLNKGVYILRITENGKRETRKLIIK
ncbi:T9SS type A sorting domain-containing protein [uncultured Algibacter sp.]|uniref:T9SS type A sorting domain-containing protein n=1 Tax=uncultured Algibacter sp. TaxID=298659 RepID=UPI0026329853|nr:T9SS type A sorting domain-containing protein [uncultured Algibacter sp.]